MQLRPQESPRNHLAPHFCYDIGVDGFITFCAQYLIVVPILATGYLLYSLDAKTRKQYLILLVCGGVLTILLAIVGSYLFDNPRPFISDGVTPLFSSSLDNGFPSDHALLAAFLAFAALVYSRRLGIALLALAVIIGWARVAGGVHHAVDMLGSFVFAGVAVLAVKMALDKRLKKINPKVPSES